MPPSTTRRIETFIKTGEKIARVLRAKSQEGLTIAEAALLDEIKQSKTKNAWFTEENVRHALEGIAFILKPENFLPWINTYDQLKKSGQNPKTVAVIMAGNLPVVGFHDFMCVLLSGHRFLGKLSSQDKHLPVRVAELVGEAQPAMNNMYSFTEGMVREFDAIIATGSNNSSRYFEYYFGRHPHIIRKNRNSLAILTGQETDDELQALSDDIFLFFGRGCRNVSKVFIPKYFDIKRLIKNFSKWEKLKDHNKFYNNYEYQKAIMLVNQTPHLDSGFSIIKQDANLSSPLAVVHYDTYSDAKELGSYINLQRGNIQCIVSSDPRIVNCSKTVLPGKAQSPGPSEFADGVDTIAFLTEL